jgi:hypothetical protein
MALPDPPLQDSIPPQKTSRLRFRPTLAAFGRAARFLSLTAIAQAAGIPRQTLFTRLRRGGPELSDAESTAVTDELSTAGIVLEN